MSKTLRIILRVLTAVVIVSLILALTAQELALRRTQQALDEYYEFCKYNIDSIEQLNVIIDSLETEIQTK